MMRTNNAMRSLILYLSLVFAALSMASAWSNSPAEKETGDFNFDGHEDYRIVSDEPGNQCGWFEYFLFDPSTSEHRHVDTNFCKEEFDAEQKLVVTRVNGGMAGLIYAVRHFRWDGLELVPVYLEKQDIDLERQLVIRTRVTNLDHFSGPGVVTEVLTPEEAGVDLSSWK